jgi:hypothetical protein
MYKYGYIAIDGIITSKIIVLVEEAASLYGAFESIDEYEVGYVYSSELNTYIPPEPEVIEDMISDADLENIVLELENNGI